MLTTLISFIVLLLILIFVHELGHFLAAKLLGVKVEKFSLGFPPKVFAKKIGETEYQLAWLPLGGYVSLYGEQPGQKVPPNMVSRSFSHKPFWVKGIIVLAGPFFNILFAVLALWVLTFAVGIQHVAPVLGPVSPASPAERAGLRAGDVVLSVEGEPIAYFDELLENPVALAGGAVNLSVRRGAETLDVRVVPERKEGRTILGDREAYYYYGFAPRTVPVIGEVISGSAASRAGFARGDEIVSVNGQGVGDWSEVVKIIRGRDGAETVDDEGLALPVDIEFLRDGVPQLITVVPDLEPSQDLEGETHFTPIVGISPRLVLLRENVGPFRAFLMGASGTYEMGKLTIVSLVKLIQREISPKVMGGPILIAEVAGKKAREGVADFVWLMVFISVNLAIINLVPIPIVDGGQFLLFFIEWVKRKPISLRAREITQWAGVSALAALMILVFYNDISRLITKYAGPPSHVESSE
ncbi:MAG: RIP metalloprotease RseP [Deltaproteobacteria bacterium]|jgi:regulator of sigma E protease|nr:RIP metalloprotease RseP [Deltaproteobacteria bacterium]